MQGSIIDIKSKFRRRSVLIGTIVPAVLLYMVVELYKTVMRIIGEAETTFKQVWKGE